MNANGKTFGSFGVVITFIGAVFVLITMSLVCAVFSPVWANWRETEKQRRGTAMTADPDRNDEPEPIELPRPKRTLLGRLTHWVEHAQALKGWVQEARRSSPALDATFETIERDSHIGGGILAGALSYRLFVFLLPLAFFLVSGLGLLASALGVQPHVVVNSVGIAGTVTKQVQGAAKGSSSWWVALTSLLVLAYMTRVLLRAVAIVHALAWEGSAASVKVHFRQLEIFAAALAGQLLLVAGVGAVHHQTAIGGIIALVVFVLALAGLWLVVSLHAAPRRRTLDRPDPRIAVLRDRLRRRTDLQHPHPRPDDQGEVDHLRRARDRRRHPPRPLPDRPGNRRSRRGQRHALRAQLPLTTRPGVAAAVQPGHDPLTLLGPEISRTWNGDSDPGASLRGEIGSPLGFANQGSPVARVQSDNCGAIGVGSISSTGSSRSSPRRRTCGR